MLMVIRKSGYQVVGYQAIRVSGPEIYDAERRRTGDAVKRIFSLCRRVSPSPCQMILLPDILVLWYPAS
jgi:hypothetical protein